MAYKKSSYRTMQVNSRIKDPVKPLWMRLVFIVTMTLIGIFLLAAVAGYMIRYYQLLSNHS